METIKEQIVEKAQEVLHPLQTPAASEDEGIAEGPLTFQEAKELGEVPEDVPEPIKDTPKKAGFLKRSTNLFGLFGSDAAEPEERTAQETSAAGPVAEESSAADIAPE